MKNLIQLSAIFCFVLLLASCEKDRENIETQALTENMNSFKGEDDEIIFVHIPTILGHLPLISQQITDETTVNLVGVDVIYDVTTIVNIQGDYTFNNVPVGIFKRTVFIGGALDNVATYIVQY